MQRATIPQPTFPLKYSHGVVADLAVGVVGVPAAKLAALSIAPTTVQSTAGGNIVTGFDHVELVNGTAGNLTYQLPTPPAAGRHLTLTASGIATSQFSYVLGNVNNKSSNISFAAPFASATLVSTGTSWRLVAAPYNGTMA